jgi:hypothetical protein
MGMTFKRQSALTLAIGLLLMCPMALAAWVGLLEVQTATWQIMALYACSALFMLGSIAFGFSLLRVWGKFAYHIILPRWPFWVYNTPQSLRQTIADNPVVRWIYWIDERGEDRDRDA